MSVSDIYNRRKQRWNQLLNNRKKGGNQEKECGSCHAKVNTDTLKINNWICPECGFLFPVPAYDRFFMLLDADSFRELSPNLESKDPISFPGYEEKLVANKGKSGLNEAFVAGGGSIMGNKVLVGVLDQRFLMGSMGTVVGEKITRLTEYARRKKLPLIIFSASGGARMQEGLFSLMQMAKTAAAVKAFKDEGGLFISVLTNPTTGGVSASFASLGDIIIAEPGALICFAGPRVIEQTIGQTLPEGFQRAEFLLEHGMIDMILERSKMRNTIGKIISMHRRDV